MDFFRSVKRSFVRITAASIASRLRLFGDVSNCHSVLSSWRSRTLKLGKHRLLRLLFSLKPKEMAKMRLLAIWVDQKYSFKSAKKIL